MKPLLFIVTLLVCFRCYGQTDYYLANNGDDNNSGKSTTPFKTINKLNSLSLKPGDNVHFKCGDTFKGQINILTSGTQSNPITFTSYGQGNKPIINASTEIKNWAQLPGKSIWQATIPERAVVNELYINSQPALLSRYPQSSSANKGFLTIASHVGRTQVTSKEKINGNWAGAEFVYMPNQYQIERCKIVSQSGNTLTIASNNYDITDGWGFFIQNHTEALTNDGDWCVDTGKNVISIYYAKGNPNNQKIEASENLQGIYMINCSNVIISNLEVDQAICGLNGANLSSIKISGVKIDHTAEDGIRIRGKCSDILIENNEIDHANNDGIYIYKADNFKCLNNAIKNTGLRRGRGKSGTGQYTAIDYTGDASGNATIQGNKIDSVGYLGIGFTSINILIKNNVVSNFCLIKSDGGGIYTYNGSQKNNNNQVITANIILGTHIDPVPVCNIHPHVDGIYMDDCSQNATISDNTVANCENSGIFLHGSQNVTVTGNTCYNNNIQLLLNRSLSCDNVGNQTSNNVFFSKTKAQPVAIYGKQKNPASDYGAFNNNLYISPDTTQAVISGFDTESKLSKRMSLSSWKSTQSKDKSSRSLGGNQMYNNNIKFVYNPSSQAKTVQLDGKYKDVKNNILNGQVTLPPYSSAILLQTK